MDPKKVSGVTEWKTPKNKRDVQSFLGFANYYRRFIRDFSLIAKPMTRLTGNVEWQWDEDEQLAFDMIKEAITTAPVLAIPNHEDLYKVECDASDFATGAILSQKQNDKWHPVAFISKSLTKEEKNYQIYDKEMLSMMLALREWRHYLKGAKQQFEIWSDHRNLT